MLVVVCHLTKYVAARALTNKAMREVLDKLKDMYLTYGVPKVIQHDKGPEFTSKVHSLILLATSTVCLLRHVLTRLNIMNSVAI